MTEDQLNNIIILIGAMAEKSKIEAIGDRGYQATHEYGECLDIIGKTIDALKESI